MKKTSPRKKRLLVKSQRFNEFPRTPYVRIPLAAGGETLISREDYSWVKNHSWTIKKSFYRSYVGRWTKINGQRTFKILHRVITRCPSDYVVHHINHNTLDNRRDNLQVLTKFEHKEYHSYR